MDFIHLVHILFFNNYFNSYRKIFNFILCTSFPPLNCIKRKDDLWLSIVITFIVLSFIGNWKMFSVHQFWIYLKEFLFRSNLYPDFSDKTEIGDTVYIHTSIEVIYVVSGLNGHPEHRSQNWHYFSWFLWKQWGFSWIIAGKDWLEFKGGSFICGPIPWSTRP